MDVELITVGYNSAGVPGGVAAAPRALREAGLAAPRGPGVAVHDPGAVPLGLPHPQRGSSGLLAEQALVEMVHAVRASTREALASGRLPLVVGGDCPVLLGGLAACREAWRGVGLLFVDGHEDAWPPHRSVTGEAADCELGIALGHHREALPERLRALMPVADPRATVALGPRDGAELAEYGVPSLAPDITLFRPEILHAAHQDGTLAELVIGRLTRLHDGDRRWWLHTDLDVLSTDHLAAVDYPQPGGLTWTQLRIITRTALAHPGCAGWTVTIYNPDLDPGRAAAPRIVEFVHDCLAAAARG